MSCAAAPWKRPNSDIYLPITPTSKKCAASAWGRQKKAERSSSDMSLKREWRSENDRRRLLLLWSVQRDVRD